MRLSSEQVKALKQYVDARIAEKIEEAFGRDPIHEAVRRGQIEEELDRILSE